MRCPVNAFAKGADVRIEENPLAVTGLRFFGQLSASISHEIKNVLAIINENAGLMEDLALMGEKGVPVSPDRLVRIAGSIAGQVQRADAIVRNWNRFAHSIDRMSEEVDLLETTRFVSTLTSRLVSMKNIIIEVAAPSDNPIILHTSLYFIENIIWKCIETALSIPLENNTLTIVLEKKDGKPRIGFSGFLSDGIEPMSLLSSEMDRSLLAVLNANVEIETDNRSFVLIF